jgi:hypothetical protein
MFQNPTPSFNVPTYLIHVDCGAHVTYHNQAHYNVLCLEASQTSNSVQDWRYLWQKVFNHRPVSNPLFFLFFYVKETILRPLGTNNFIETSADNGLRYLGPFFHTAALEILWCNNPSIVPLFIQTCPLFISIMTCELVKYFWAA